jgi:hypothetical protein
VTITDLRRLIAEYDRQTFRIGQLVDVLVKLEERMGNKLMILLKHGYPGFGANITGGNGGSVVMVTTLSDHVSSPPAGSLREAINNLTGAPTSIVFAVSGRLQLAGELKLENVENLTVDGGGNIEITRYRTLFAGCENVIWRRMRHRIGLYHFNQTGQRLDCIQVYSNDAGTPSTRVCIDSCSVALWLDEGITISNSQESIVYNCVLGYGLNTTGHALPSILQGDKIGYYGNYVAHARFRPQIGGTCQVANCLFYNYSDSDPIIINAEMSFPAATTDVDITDCRFVGGPSTVNNTPPSFRAIRVSHNGASLHQARNAVILYGSTAEIAPVVRANPGVTYSTPNTAHFISAGLSVPAMQAHVTAGCPNPDAIDLRLQSDFANRTGQLITDPSQVGWSE